VNEIHETEKKILEIKAWNDLKNDEMVFDCVLLLGNVAITPPKQIPDGKWSDGLGFDIMLQKWATTQLEVLGNQMFYLPGKRDTDDHFIDDFKNRPIMCTTVDNNLHLRFDEIRKNLVVVGFSTHLKNGVKSS
jgi:hypothetical protein